MGQLDKDNAGQQARVSPEGRVIRRSDLINPPPLTVRNGIAVSNSEDQMGYDSLLEMADGGRQESTNRVTPGPAGDRGSAEGEGGRRFHASAQDP